MTELTDLEVGAPSAGAAERIAAHLAQMTLEQKLAQLVGYWADSDDGVVAPMQGAMGELDGLPHATRHGLGHLTRVYGTRPVAAVERRRWLREVQRDLVARTGVGAIVHEECLTGLAAWRAASFPTPLAWGAAFDPALVTEMATAIGTSMRELGVHQGLAPVLDVVRDPRWGRVEECLGEDPFLVGTLGTAYVRGLQSAGVIATLKHFVGYSASTAGRNFAPVAAGPREVADVLLVPFEMAVLDGGARSVMHSYAEIDGVPVAADPRLLTDLLRERWGFAGTLVADYFGVAFLHRLHGVAADLGEAAALALAAGVDVELPTGDAYLEPLAARVEGGLLDVALVDRAVERVLRQKAELGLFEAPAADERDDPVDLDPPGHRRIAARLAERSAVLLANDGTLPLAAPARVAVVGPNADRVEALFGCYAFVNHVLPHHRGLELGIDVPTVLEAVRAQWPTAHVTHVPGCTVAGSLPDDAGGLGAAVAAASDADVAIVVVGDSSGLFGRGTVGEGCDTDDLELPGVQRVLVEAVVATGTPTVLVLLTGRPYAVGWALEACGAVVQAFFPGEEGAGALARILSGAVMPSGRLPVSLPRSAGSQPATYLHPPLGGDTEVSSVPTAPALPFGFGLSYTTFAHEDLTTPAEVPTDGVVEARVRVANTGARNGQDVVQLYARDPVASVTRPVAQLVGFARVELEPGEEVEVTFRVPTARLAFSDRDLVRVVEPGDVELWVGASCADKETTASVRLVGPVHVVSRRDARETGVVVGGRA
ncbi:glycoside hydrolase family 3 domain protein [Beutenbergia cavernae DSM 12333]|uniref:Exo-alpha-(1->6)-L-arabinopyranosidase n=1 Tax=Beutenbergia cavernae (strain ATCC BAA-8 / DSM 12333 / CCUG 43141 / JCM 11478 / NBRC 16432 / NCIMB 13614 / HKI 0122) TaxID=471853 RepID=C5BY61_BEUC1|nr:glycoside hydrolase family 3 N-terminal domain-containing protein [Beutenbergia cavernae]ACQ80961.1 glycoside hydrolase family 3 domain protein [Beutenbergia cavernae DSM 12333]